MVDRTDTREAARLDFEWVLGDHQLRFGMDRESNTSEHSQAYPGADRLLYEIFALNPAAPATVNGVTLPLGTSAYVRTRQNEIIGEFETLNTAYYLEDNWSVTDNLVLNAGLRLEAFDNMDADGDSYIKIDDMVAPRVGFSWDMKGDNRTKLFGNAGRYFLPVANVINIKQAGPLPRSSARSTSSTDCNRATTTVRPISCPSSARRSGPSTFHRATARSGTCVRKSTRTWIPSTRTN